MYQERRVTRRIPMANPDMRLMRRASRGEHNVEALVGLRTPNKVGGYQRKGTE